MNEGVLPDKIQRQLYALEALLSNIISQYM